jgi:pimeloyl-ACP methyl ester carboxylesterase
MEEWRDYGYVDAMKDDYRLILIDARGHGGSDKPHDVEAYDLKPRSADVVAVLDDIGVDKAHFWGYSMGGEVCFGLAKYAPERALSFMIGGMSPYEVGFKILDPRVQRLRQGMEAYVAAIEERQGPVEPVRRARILANDSEALVAAAIEKRDFKGIEEVLPTMTMPCLVYVGELIEFLFTGAQEAVKHMPNVTWVPMTGLGHVEASTQSDLVLPHVTAFLNKVAEGPGR